MNKEQWEAHSKYVHDVILPAAIKAALARPMTEDEHRDMEEYQHIFGTEPEKI